MTPRGPGRPLSRRALSQVLATAAERLAAAGVRSGFFPRKIMANGTLKWERRPIIVSTALAGWTVGLRYLDADHLEVWFRHLLLGQIEISSMRFLRGASPPQTLTQLSA